jgi:ribose 5-phosphate isomerase RpiB
MKIAIVNETSAADKNKDILAALAGRCHTIINAGMTEKGAGPELTYIHTGFLSALLLHAGIVDFVIGGCGTGQGFLNSVMQYPNIVCGLIANPLDAWLFSQINAGNCISLPLNYGYGWAGDANLRFIFDKLFSGEAGCGYPASRRESQKQSRERLATISKQVHISFAKIVSTFDSAILQQVLDYPGVRKLLDIASLQDNELRQSLQHRLQTGKNHV